MPKTRHRPEPTGDVERAASDFASKTLARLAKLGCDERATRLAAFRKVVERVESRATASRRPGIRPNRVATRLR